MLSMFYTSFELKYMLAEISRVLWLGLIWFMWSKWMMLCMLIAILVVVMLVVIVVTFLCQEIICSCVVQFGRMHEEGMMLFMLFIMLFLWLLWLIYVVVVMIVFMVSFWK